MSANAGWLNGWWSELSEERRQQWLALPLGGDVPAELARGLVTYSARERRDPPVTGTDWASRGVSAWHVAADVWEFVEKLQREARGDDTETP